MNIIVLNCQGQKIQTPINSCLSFQFVVLTATVNAHMNSFFQSIYQEVDIALIADPLIPCVLWRVTNIITVCGQSNKTDDIDPYILARRLHVHMFVPAAMQNLIILLLN